MDRSNHYEAAFEAYLQERRLCYVGVDERRRAVLGEEPVKNLDFIVLTDHGARLLVDIKGRRFPGQCGGKQRFTWECWSTVEDISGLVRWKRIFGPDYQALLLFIYDLQPTVSVPEDTIDLWHWRERRYLLRAVSIEDYRLHMRRRSPKWGTVTLPHARFRELVKPFVHFTQEEDAEFYEVEAGSMSEIAGTPVAAGACGSAAAAAGWR